ncbi:hypothetical protein WJX79_010215 [Trebouxia sp. C0005]|nr:MAG: hypothetical protein FRX49_04486 [Trebouxia sp. A1-2]
MLRRVLQQEVLIRHFGRSSACRTFAGGSAGVGNSTKAPSTGDDQRGETAISQHDEDYVSNLKETQGKASNAEGGLAGGQMSPGSAAAQGDAGDDRGGKTDKTDKASGKASTEDDDNTGAIGGTQTKKGKVGTGAPTDIGR